LVYLRKPAHSSGAAGNADLEPTCRVDRLVYTGRGENRASRRTSSSRTSSALCYRNQLPYFYTSAIRIPALPVLDGDYLHVGALCVFQKNFAESDYGI
jgi:hypothetical protein